MEPNPIMANKQQETSTDGRILRSERSRQAIIDAMLELVSEGVLIPTAQQVSELAGVGIRTVFRHFSDMEGLYATSDSVVRKQYAGLFQGGNREGSLEERILHAVEQHAIAYDAIGNTFLSTKALMWQYDLLKKQYEVTQKQIREDLEDWLPELKTLPTEQLEAIDAIASFEMWHRLRHLQGLSKSASIRLINSLIQNILQ
jgi:AcrR family transcriptional regulator